ncbi:hypothetical protein A9Z42_0047610 [Trichoderma parareesei]|uniref:Uncharacterized protein n=1 Tax=Trichoderma parareesei TaxID=858221 RepID=A0A2H2ZU48_TRIPA|nr:hypothetical protein A9Z42_0047610 [Trichoderma parareesei]
MRVQRTFTVVPPPGPAERTPLDNRPMTSKQVRKAYREANRVPRVSKAELRRQERAEQERIRRELEKEKAASKAKALREKKRAKEQAEREEKKKKGLPLVNVRPSQDTIARFVRGNGSGSKRDCQGRNASGAPVLPIAEESEEDDLPSPKRTCETWHELGDIAEEPEQDDDESVNEPVAEKKVEDKDKSAAIQEPEAVAALEPLTKLDNALEEPPAEDVTTRHNEPIGEEDLLEGFEVLSDDEISRLSFNTVIARPKVDDAEYGSPAGQDASPRKEGKGLVGETALQPSDSPVSLKNPEPIQEFDLISDDEEDLELEMLALDVVLTSQQQLPKKPLEHPLPHEPEKPVPTAAEYETNFGLAAGLEELSSPNRQACLMPPPPLPAPQRSPSLTSPVAMRPQAPPLSTQQILYNMDDFFPTSSQQAAELEEEETTFISQHTKSGSTPVPQAASPVTKKNSPLPAETTSSSPGTPKPFFTASGTNERLAVALLHSRRTAEREEEERRRAAELEALEFEEAKRREAERLARLRQTGNEPTKSAESTKTETYEKPQAPRQAKPITTMSPQFPTGKAFIPNANRAPSRAVTQRRPLVETRANAALPAKVPPVSEAKKGSPAATIPQQQLPPTSDANKPLPLKTQIGPFYPKDQNIPTKTFNKENKIAPDFDEFKDPMASQESEFGGSWMDELATELSL